MKTTDLESAEASYVKLFLAIKPWSRFLIYTLPDVLFIPMMDIFSGAGAQTTNVILFIHFLRCWLVIFIGQSHYFSFLIGSTILPCFNAGDQYLSGAKDAVVTMLSEFNSFLL